MPMRTVCADAAATKPASNPAASGATANRNTLTFLIAISPVGRDFDSRIVPEPARARAHACRAPACPQIGPEEMSPGKILEPRGQLPQAFLDSDLIHRVVGRAK